MNVHKVFGVDLVTLKEAGVAFDDERNVPKVVVTCVEFLLGGDRRAEQGIFRLAGDHQRVQALRDSVDQGEGRLGRRAGGLACMRGGRAGVHAGRAGGQGGRAY